MKWFRKRKPKPALESPELENLALGMSIEMVGTVDMRRSKPPEGWFPLGSLVNCAYVDVEFSEERGPDGLPLWERKREVS